MARADVVIIGGGVAGLWCRWSLSRAGYGVVLLERSALGDGQTVLSQGILHRGVKYAVSPMAMEAARQAGASALAWDLAMRGEDGPDLRDVRVLARSMHMWTDGSILAKATGAVAAKVLSSHVRPLEKQDWPALFAGRGGSVYQVDETVIDSRSALERLMRAGTGPIVRSDVSALRRSAAGVTIETDAGSIDASAALLCSGAGNESLLALLGEDASRWAQRRPLHMVFARGAPGAMYGHWVATASDKPRLTVTSSEADGGTVWYLGGELAESGVARSEGEQIAFARQELAACFPGLDTCGWIFGTVRVDRAEGKDSAGRRPNGPVVREVGDTSVLAVWPTKLVMAPAAAQGVLERLRAKATGACDLGSVGPIDYALPPWQLTA